MRAKTDDLVIAMSKRQLKSLGYLVEHFGELYPSNGALLLFAKDRTRWFPDAVIRCVCFAGGTRSTIIDHKEFAASPLEALEQAIAFVERHTPTRAEIGRLKREDVFLFPPLAVREAIVNAVLHTDYAMQGCSVQVAVFQDRLEITNPGGLPYGQTLEDAVGGVSRLRNRFIAKTFRKAGIVEALGTGLQRIVQSCLDRGLGFPLLEERSNQFRLTLFSGKNRSKPLRDWESDLLKHLQTSKSISPSEAAAIWGVTTRTARSRLKAMAKEGLLVRLATAERDPYARYLPAIGTRWPTNYVPASEKKISGMP